MPLFKIKTTTMSNLKSICVFCGSSKGFSPKYEAISKQLGTRLAEQNIDIIYGAGNVGLMGVVADAALAAGGKVVGIIPDFLKKWEVYHQNLTELIITETMHQRKWIMEERSDSIIVLPGGFGTLDEFFEILTWKQLHLHEKPIGILNIDGFYDPLLAHIHNMVKEGFVKDINLELFVVADSIDSLLEQMQNAKATKTGKWQ